MREAGQLATAPAEEGMAGTLCFLIDLRLRPKAGGFFSMEKNRRKNSPGICLGGNCLKCQMVS